MENKIIKTVSTLMFLFLICSCGSKTTSNSTSSINTSQASSSILASTSSSSTITSTSTSVIPKSFSEMLDEVKNPNITYHSDYLVYYYENKNPSEVLTLQRYDVVAKITEELYDMKAYEYGTKNIASRAHLERDEDGYVTNSEININNKLVVTRVQDGRGEEFLWEESVYYNLIKYMDSDDFEKVNVDTYVYRGDLNNLPLSIVHTAIPTSTFDLETLMVKTKNNAIESFYFQEKESDEVYEDCMYGRNINLTFEDIGVTTIDRIEPYEEKEENNDLGAALLDMRTQTNYTITSTGILEDGTTKPLKETFITEKDILQNQYTETGVFKTGIHTYNGELYTFETVDKYLLGTKTNSKIKDNVPKFYFSEYVFEYLGENDEGCKVYKPYSSMSAVLNYIDVLSQYQDEYYSPAGDIKFFVKEEKLIKIEFPVFLYDSANYVQVTNRISYENIGTTTINSTIWSSFVLEIPSNNASSWYDPNYDMLFEYSETYKDIINLGVLFEKCLGNPNGVPYFLPSSSNFEASGNYSNGTKPFVYVNLTSLKGIDYEAKDNIIQVLTGAGFEYSSFRDELMQVDQYTNGVISIDVIMIPIDNHMEIEITLPVGNLFN